MKILGVSLGHDSNFTFLNDGKIVGIIETERYFRVKHYKLHSLTLQPGKKVSGFQYKDIATLIVMLSNLDV